MKTKNILYEMGYFCMRKLGRFQNPVMSFYRPGLYVTQYMRFPEPWLGLLGKGGL